MTAVETLRVGHNLFGAQPYETRSTETLRENLASVAETYRDADRYTLYNKHASRINIVLLNEGEEYVEDARFELLIPHTLGVLGGRRLV